MTSERSCGAAISCTAAGHVLIYAGDGEVIHASDGIDDACGGRLLAEFMAGRGFDFDELCRAPPPGRGS